MNDSQGGYSGSTPEEAWGGGDKGPDTFVAPTMPGLGNVPTSPGPYAAYPSAVPGGSVPLSPQGPYAPYGQPVPTTPGSYVPGIPPGAYPPYQPLTHPARQPRGLVVAVVVLALIVAGLGGWAVTRYVQGGGTPPVTPGHTGPAAPATSPTTGPLPTVVPTTITPATVPFDLPGATAGWVKVLGIWSGIALFDLMDYHSYAEGIDQLRAVRVGTGELLWSLDNRPDGSPFRVTGVAESNGRLALSFDPLLLGGCPATYIAVLDLATGRTITDRTVDAECDESGVRQSAAVLADVNGVLVLSQMSRVISDPNKGITRAGRVTTAYSDDNLAVPRWEVAADLGGRTFSDWWNATGGWGFSAPVLGDRWVRSDAGVYVAVATGEPSSMVLPVLPPDSFGLDPLTYIASADNVLAVSKGTSGDTVSGGWDSAGEVGAWTYALAPDWWVPYQSIECEVTGGVALNVWQQEADGQLAETGLTMLNTADGSPRWAVAYAPPGTVRHCGATTYGDQELVAYEVGTVIEVADAATGGVIGRTGNLADSGGQTDVLSIDACGDGIVCVVTQTDTLNVPEDLLIQAIDCRTPDLKIIWSSTASSLSGQVFPTDTGLMIPTIAADGTYQFLTL